MILFRSFIITLPFYAVLMASEPFYGIAVQVDGVLPSIVKIKVQRSEGSEDENELISADSGATGFIFDDNRHIMTNAHVIGDARKIAVVDQYNTEYTATLIGKDDKTDIALLQVAQLDLPALKSGSSTALKLGDALFVVGFPFSLGPSVSQGIVGALERFLPNYPYIRFIQTDAAVNPGNSGGPMFNLDGEVVGMVSTYFSRQGGYTNIAFAIPIEDASRIAAQLINEGKIERGYWGGDMLISEKVARKMGQQAAVLITHIEPNSPADIGGVKAGDVIVGVNGHALKDSGELHRILERSRPDEKLSVTVVRDKRLSVIEILLGTFPEKKEITSNIATGDKAEKLGLILRQNGQRIEVVISHAIAKMAGFQPNDQILRINGKTLKSIMEFNAYLTTLKANEIALIELLRSGDTLTLPIGSKTALQGYTTQN